MANNIIQSGDSVTIQSGHGLHPAHILSAAVGACTEIALENDRLTTSMVDCLHALNDRLVELDRVMKLAYGDA